MNRTLHFTIALSALSGTFAHGCVVETGTFDPRGSEVSLSGSWTVNGQTPTAQICADAQIETIQIEVREDIDTIFADDPTFLRYPCADGSFDTRPEAVLDNDRYLMSWIALAASGEEIGRSEPITVDVTFEDHADIGTSDFEVGNRNLTLNLRWDADPGAAEQLDGCGPLQTRLRTDLNQADFVLNMAYTLERLDAAGGTPTIVEEQTNALCKDESSNPPFNFSGLTPGSYQVTIEGVDVNGGKLPAGFPYLALCGPYDLSQADQTATCDIIVNQ
ncbi:MAG: hypothetical protein ACPGUV_04620 [Polyangiales bacterium]